MKKLALYFGSLLLLTAIGCKDDNPTPEYSVVGVWKPVKMVMTTINGPVSDSQTFHFSTCQQQSRWTFNADLTGSEKMNDEVAPNDCQQISSENITYTYDKASSAMTIKHANNTTDNGRVVLLNATDMNLNIEKTDATGYHSSTYTFVRVQ